MGVTSKLDPRRPAGGVLPAVSGVAANLLGLPWPVKGKGRAGVVICLLVVLATGCAGSSLRPENAAGAKTYSQEAGGLRVSVEAEAWHGRPRKLTDYILPFLVQIRNSGLDPVSIARTDFLLVDDSSRQYLPLPPAEVVSLLGGHATSGIALAPSISVEGSTGGGTVFGGGLGIALGGYGSDTRDVIPDALPEGPIPPGAEARGFLYFPPPASGFKSLRLVLIIRNLLSPPRLDFEFRRTGV
jgi:hypothetical protein